MAIAHVMTTHNVAMYQSLHAKMRETVAMMYVTILTAGLFCFKMDYGPLASDEQKIQYFQLRSSRAILTSKIR